ncbi:hypothetical protein EVAR_97953_1 [Eumeta japonica]|uniref:Uncharacterized protein n=1 Tax=Eumeta variegata TaxID=151549 RepID=A0A4C1SZE3_EUMVA|nr:hypothetical protein EVAR_97953_1 [Eumeta japonica]
MSPKEVRVIPAARGHSQSERSHQGVPSLLGRNKIFDEGGSGVMEREWTTGILTHWTKLKAEAATSRLYSVSVVSHRTSQPTFMLQRSWPQITLWFA